MSYYISKNNVKEGPYSFEELFGKNIKPNTLVWRQGFPNWKAAKDVQELSQARHSFDNIETMLRSL